MGNNRLLITVILLFLFTRLSYFSDWHPLLPGDSDAYFHLRTNKGYLPGFHNFILSAGKLNVNPYIIVLFSSFLVVLSAYLIHPWCGLVAAVYPILIQKSMLRPDSFLLFFWFLLFKDKKYFPVLAPAYLLTHRSFLLFSFFFLTLLKPAFLILIFLFEKLDPVSFSGISEAASIFQYPLSKLIYILGGIYLFIFFIAGLRKEYSRKTYILLLFSFAVSMFSVRALIFGLPAVLLITAKGLRRKLIPLVILGTLLLPQIAPKTGIAPFYWARENINSADPANHLYGHYLNYFGVKTDITAYDFSKEIEDVFLCEKEKIYYTSWDRKNYVLTIRAFDLEFKDEWWNCYKPIYSEDGMIFSEKR